MSAVFRTVLRLRCDRLDVDDDLNLKAQLDELERVRTDHRIRIEQAEEEIKELKQQVADLTRKFYTL